MVMENRMDPKSSLKVDADRLWATIDQSARIGRFRDTGLRRLALSPEDRQMRDLFIAWVRQDGCAVEVDPVGNIFARRPGSDPRADSA